MSTVDLSHPSESFIHMSDHPSVYDDSEYTDSSIIDTTRLLRRAHELDEARTTGTGAPVNLVSMHSTPLVNRPQEHLENGHAILDALSQDSSSATLKGELEPEVKRPTLASGRTYTAEEITAMFAPMMGTQQVAETISGYGKQASGISSSPKLQSPHTNTTQKSQQLALESIITPPDSHEHSEKKRQLRYREPVISETPDFSTLMDQIHHLRGHNQILQRRIQEMGLQMQDLELDLVRARNLAGLQDIESSISMNEFEVEKEDPQEQMQQRDNQIASLESKVSSLKHQLSTMSRIKDELSNENNYLIKNHVGSLDTIITSKNVTLPFQKYYDKLQLDKYDNLTKAQLVNLLKNIMLTLPISDYDHLSSNVELYGKYIKLSTQFLDQLHTKLFATNQTKPTYYLKESRNINQLRNCLQCMLQETDKITLPQ